MKRPRFGVAVPAHGGFPGGNRFDLLKQLLEFIDRSGFDSVWIEDHFRLPPNEIEASEGILEKDQPVEAWTALTAFSTWTKNVKLGTEVTPMTLRHPGILAKVSATLDIISKARVILGAGAGWNRTEFVSQGIPFEKAEVRFEKMLEAIDIVKLLWTSERSVDYHGKFYQLNGAFLAPKPISKPHPQIWFGGFSERILSAVAERGDGWINATNQSPELVRQQRERVAALLKESRRRIGVDELSVAVPLLAMVSQNRQEAENRAKEYIKRGRFDKTLRFFADTMKYGLVGTPEDCFRKISRYLDVGVNYIIFDIRPPSNALATAQLLAEKVVPAFE